MVQRLTQVVSAEDHYKHPSAKEVRISLVFTRLDIIDTINERFTCEASLLVTWRERLKSSISPSASMSKAATAMAASSAAHSDTEDEAGSISYLWDPKNFWDPQLYIENAIGDVKEKDVKIHFEKVWDRELSQWVIEVRMIKKIQGTFFEKLELYHFPFDVQDLSLTLTSHRTVDEVILVEDTDNPSRLTKSASLDKHIWKLYDHVNIKLHTLKNDLFLSSDFFSRELDDHTCSHSAITFQCRVSRKSGYFVVNCLLPILMITLCVFFTFMMDFQRYHYRFSLLFTTMLTSITFRWAIHGRVLPTVSYLTFLDGYCVSSMFVVFFCMVWHAIWLFIYRRDQQLAQTCDQFAMLVFVIIVFLIHVMQTVWFFIALNKKYELERKDEREAMIHFNNLKNRKKTESTRSATTRGGSSTGRGSKKRIVYSINKLKEDDFVVKVSSQDGINCPETKTICSSANQSPRNSKMIHTGLPATTTTPSDLFSDEMLITAATAAETAVEKPSPTKSYDTAVGGAKQQHQQLHLQQHNRSLKEHPHHHHNRSPMSVAKNNNEMARNHFFKQT